MNGAPDIMCCEVCGAWKKRAETQTGGVRHPRSGQAVTGQVCTEHAAASSSAGGER